MRAWSTSSPYRWVGYYLSDAPCYTGTSWTGRRAELEGMGWGLAVLFVGEQDWDAGAGGAGADPDPGAEPPATRCTRTNLTPDRARADARAAAGTAEGDGFARGTVIYLDVERVEAASPALLEYARAWADALLEEGRYVPGLYAHASNAMALREAMATPFRSRGRADLPRLWVAASAGFTIERSPADAPIGDAWVWQGSFDVTETWGGVPLRIDANVARSRSPSS